MEATSDILRALIEKEKELSEKVLALKEAENELQKVKGAIKALSGEAPTAESPAPMNGYVARDSWPNKIKYILSQNIKATAQDIVELIMKNEPDLNENTVYNSVTANLSRMKKLQAVRATKKGKGYVYSLQ